MPDIDEIYRRTAAEVERKQNLVNGLRQEGHCPPAELIEDLETDADFLVYLKGLHQ